LSAIRKLLIIKYTKNKKTAIDGKQRIMELKNAKLEQVFTPLSGEGSNGKWKKVDAMFIYGDTAYPKMLICEFWGDKADAIMATEIGSVLTLSIDVVSREYNGKYYTNAKCFGFANDVAVKNRAANAEKSKKPIDKKAKEVAEALGGGDDDLPF